MAYYKDLSRRMVALLVDFFSGNTKPVQKEILAQIDRCIEKQHFEWAAKLRDIYVHIEKFVEKQTVVLDKPVTGKIFYMKKISDFYVFALVHFFEGKIVDLITHKERADEMSPEEIIESLRHEIGEFEIEEQNGHRWGFVQ